MSVASMPGHWPAPQQQIHRQKEPVYPPLTIGVGESSLQAPTRASPSSSRVSHEELFFDFPTVNSTEEITPGYLVFEPVVESVSEAEPTDWRRYEPAPELLRPQVETSQILRYILQPSIERIKARYREEEERRAAGARRERPLTRTGNAHARPRRQNQFSMSGALNPHNHERPDRLSAGSATSLLSTDSGYSSMPTEHESSTVAGKKIFGLSAIFRRRDKTSWSFRDLEEPDVSAVARNTPAHITTVSNTEPVVEEASSTTECVSCLDNIESGEMVILSCHSYCTTCFQRLINIALAFETHWPAKCCLNIIPKAQILPHIDVWERAKYSLREAEWSIPAGDRVYCSHPGCSDWISPQDINQVQKSGTCPLCRRKSCIICRGNWHGNSDCPQDPALQATINLAEDEGWKRCYSCHALVEHNQGCRHMTCRCKAQFCYICSARWRTCICTDAQLAAIQLEAEARRQARTADIAQREAAAEEDRIILQMVADFERAEAEREAREAEEERLRMEEERRRLEEERRVMEEARISSINQRFQQLTTELEALHDLQKVFMAERYEFEQDMIRKAVVDALETLSVRQNTEMRELEGESRRRLSEFEMKFVKEYRTRLTEEQMIEEEYMEQLQRFYLQNPKPEADFLVREARDELRGDQAREYKFWDSHRRRQIQALREGESRKLEALRVKHASEIKSVEGRAKIEDVEWKRKRKAEGLWDSEVVRERGVMLQEIEQQEYARV